MLQKSLKRTITIFLKIGSTLLLFLILLSFPNWYMYIYFLSVTPHFPTPQILKDAAIILTFCPQKHILPPFFLFWNAYFQHSQPSRPHTNIFQKETASIF